MHTTSAQFKTAVNAALRRSHLQVKIGGDDVSDHVFSMDYGHEYDSLIGGFSGRSIDLELVAAKIDMAKLLTHTITVGVRFEGAADIVPLGKFLADKESIEHDEVRGRVSVLAFDDALRFDRGYVAPKQWPMAQLSLVNYIAGKVGVTYTGTLPSLQIPRDLWADDVVSYRQVIADIAEANLMQARISRAGELEFVSAIGGTVAATIQPTHYTDLTLDAEQPPIDGVILQGEDEEDSLTKPENLQIVSKNPLTITTNSILDSDRAGLIDGVYAKINGYTYQPMGIQYFARPDLDVGDRIAVVDTKGVTHQTNIAGLTLTWKGGLRGTIKCPVLPETATQYQLAGVEQAIAANRKKVRNLETELTAYEDGSRQLFEAMGRMLGVHRTIEQAPNGGEIYYWHDREVLAESDIIWRFSAETLTWSNDGGQTWSGVNAATDTVVAKILSVLEVNAERVIVGGGQTLPDKITQIDAQGITITRLEGSVKSGGQNLIDNSDFNSENWWTINKQASWDLITARFDSWDQLEAQGVSWESLETYDW